MIATKQKTEDEIMRDLLLEMAKALVDDSAAINVELEEANGVTTLNLRVAPTDTGKLIGKQGRTARSLRVILSGAGMKLHKRYNLNIHEEGRQPTIRGR